LENGITSKPTTTTMAKVKAEAEAFFVAPEAEAVLIPKAKTTYPFATYEAEAALSLTAKAGSNTSNAKTEVNPDDEVTFVST
jgi:hypothetical protein